MTPSCGIASWYSWYPSTWWISYAMYCHLSQHCQIYGKSSVFQGLGGVSCWLHSLQVSYWTSCTYTIFILKSFWYEHLTFSRLKTQNMITCRVWCVKLASTGCPRKVDPTNGVPSYKFCFRKGSYNQVIKMPQLSATTCQTRGFIWWDSFVVMTSNVNFNTRPIL